MFIKPYYIEKIDGKNKVSTYLLCPSVVEGKNCNMGGESFQTLSKNGWTPPPLVIFF